MRRTLAALALASLLLTTNSVAIAYELEQCPDPTRPIHYPPLCLTETEWLELSAPRSPAVAPTPVYIDPVAQWEPLVRKYWPPELVGWALRIIDCESKGDPWAKNPYSTAAGLFQFLRSTWDRGPAPALGLPAYWTGAPYVPEWNIQAAAWLYAHWGGESQWTCKA